MGLRKSLGRFRMLLRKALATLTKWESFVLVLSLKVATFWLVRSPQKVSRINHLRKNSFAPSLVRKPAMFATTHCVFLEQSAVGLLMFGSIPANKEMSFPRAQTWWFAFM